MHLTVVSLVPSSPAICLLSSPVPPARSLPARAGSASQTGCAAPRSPPAARALAVAFERLLNGVEQILSRKGLVRNSTAPAFMARTLIGMSPWPVMKMMGISMPASTIRFCRSSPLRPGSRTSSTRQPGTSERYCAGTPEPTRMPRPAAQLTLRDSGALHAYPDHHPRRIQWRLLRS